MSAETPFVNPDLQFTAIVPTRADMGEASPQFDVNWKDRQHCEVFVTFRVSPAFRASNDAQALAHVYRWAAGIVARATTQVVADLTYESSDLARAAPAHRCSTDPRGGRCGTDYAHSLLDPHRGVTNELEGPHCYLTVPAQAGEEWADRYRGAVAQALANDRATFVAATPNHEPEVVTLTDPTDQRKATR